MDGTAEQTCREADFDSRLPGPVLDLLRKEPLLERAYVVGGFVRDALLGGEPASPQDDVDLEVFGRGWEELASGLGRWGRVEEVGRSFGTIKLRLPGCAVLDVSLPRSERKTGSGHRGFAVDCQPDLPLPEAMRRRDFTINALYYHPRSRQVIDCYGGWEDIRSRTLRVVAPPTFAEDPLRVLRAMQFLSRFDMEPDPGLVRISREMAGEYSTLARERIRDEWLKWAGRSKRPSRGLDFLAQGGWIAHFPEIQALAGVLQDPEWHPEGDVFRHTCHCCDAMAGLEEWRALPEQDRIVYLLATLLHDVGKPLATRRERRKGRIRIVSPGHERAGVDPAARMLERIGAPRWALRRVIPLVANHMARFETISDRAVRRLAVRLQPDTIEGLCLLMRADAMGRPPLPGDVPATVKRLQEKSAELAVQRSAPEPALRGRDLISLGVDPGPRLGDLLRKVYQAQLDGQFADRDSALEWLRSRDLI